VNRRRDRAPTPWYLYVLGVVAAGIIVFAVTQIGPPTSSARTSRQLVAAEDGVVQSTVTGSGNVEASTDDTVNFQTSGTLQDVYVNVGQHVTKGQLLAKLSPSAAQLTLNQAEDELTAAKDNLTSIEDGDSTSGSSGNGGSSDDGSQDTSYDGGASTEFVSEVRSVSGLRGATTTPTSTTTTPTETTTYPTGTSPAGSSPTRTVTVTVTTTTPSPSTGTGSSHHDGTDSSTTSTTDTTGSSGTTNSSDHGTETNTTTTTTPSPAAIASAKASVDSAEATVKNDRTALDETKLYAPVSGTIATLSDDSPGQAISADGSSSSDDDSSSSSSSSSGSGGLAAETAGGLGSSSSSSSSSSGFATIINAGTLTMTVALSESDIGSVKVGQAATISLDALSGVELGAHVTSISPVGTTSEDVVSYDVTLTADQGNSEIRPGMSASATIVTGQQQGVTVPNEAITGEGSTGTVNVMKNGKTVSQQIVIGLRGTSRSVVLSGVSAGEDVVEEITLPALGTTSTTSTSSSGTLGGTSGLGGGGFAERLLGGGGGFPGGGGSGFFRGGG